jgi:crotonobetaine/carnitine-CoA ligase
MYLRIDDPSGWAMPLVVEAQAAIRPNQRCVSMVEGESLTYGGLRDQAAKVAALLRSLGAGPGDHVAVMLPNCLDVIRAWAGIGRLGAVAVMLNTELTQAFLAHPLSDSRPKLLIVHPEYLERIEPLQAAIAGIEQIIVTGASPPGAYIAFEAWRTTAPIQSALPDPSDLACIMYTSGTTGPPKGVLMPHTHCFLFGLGVVENLGITPDDRYYIVLPLFHANGLLMQLCGTLIAGAHATVRERFSATAWLDDVRASGATVTHSLGATSAFIMAQPPTSRDREHSLRAILSAPNVPDHERAWRTRFGVPEVLGGYGMTEVNIPLYGERGNPRPGACGRPYSRFFEVEIRDPETDAPLPLGAVGEIMVRPKVAGGFMAGYHNLPARTVEAWRNLWFHTGDAGRMDIDGYVTFVDRIKDCIRRRGENISAADIEAGFLSLAGVAEIAAFAVPSDIDGGEDEIMLAIVAASNTGLTAEAIAAHARATMPRFARPRYLEFRSSLPKTGTEKVRKVELKGQGVTAATIDLQGFYG